MTECPARRAPAHPGSAPRRVRTTTRALAVTVTAGFHPVGRAASTDNRRCVRAENELDVPDADPRARRPGRCHRRRDAVRRRLQRGPPRAGLPSFGSERTGRPGRRLLPHRRPPIRAARADRRARRADRAGPDAAAPGRCVRRASRADGYLLSTRRRLDELGLASSRAASAPSRAATVPATELARAHLGRPLPNAALLGGFAALTGLCRSTRGGGHPRAVRRAGGGGTSRPPPRRSIRAATRGEPAMLKQIEGSRAVAEAVALCRPEVICAYPISPQTHIVEALARSGEVGQLDALRVRQRRVRVRRDVGRDRRLGGRRAHVHRDREPGPALHGRGALQRVRARACRS